MLIVPKVTFDIFSKPVLVAPAVQYARFKDAFANIELFPPVQIALGVAVTEDTETAGAEVIAVVAVFVQPFPSVPVTVYVVVAAGVALTDVPVVADRPAEGAQVYVLAPPAVKPTAVPGLQYNAEVGLTVTVGKPLIFNVYSAVADELPKAQVVVTI